MIIDHIRSPQVPTLGYAPTVALSALGAWILSSVINTFLLSSVSFDSFPLICIECLVASTTSHGVIFYFASTSPICRMCCDYASRLSTTTQAFKVASSVRDSKTECFSTACTEGRIRLYLHGTKLDLQLRVSERSAPRGWTGRDDVVAGRKGEQTVDEV